MAGKSHRLLDLFTDEKFIIRNTLMKKPQLLGLFTGEMQMPCSELHVAV